MTDFLGILSFGVLVLTSIALLGALGVAAGVIVALRGRGDLDGE